MRGQDRLLVSLLAFALLAFPTAAQELQPSEGMDDSAGAVGEALQQEVVPADPSIPATTEIAPPSGPGEVAAPLPPPAPKNFNTAILQGLNKVTARTGTVEAPLGEVIRFGNLEIVARSCWQSAEATHPENAALLEIWELKPAEAPARVFMGWMFASSPSLTALQHPVYDITVVKCENREVKDE